MSQINKLPEEIDFDAICDHWLKIGRSTERCNRPKIEAAIRRIYEFGGQKSPDVILWADSPFSAPEIIANYANLGKEEIKKELLQTLYSWYFGGSIGTSYWIAYYDAARQIGVKYQPEQEEILNAMIDLTECGHWFPFDNIVIACEKPIEINIDAQGQLHNENGHAMLFIDGYGIWAIHGITVDQYIVENPELITAKLVLKEGNSEIRRVMCERMGWDKFINEANLKLISECPDPGNFNSDGTQKMLRLYKTPELIEGTAVNLLHCINGTPKPNGAIPQYGITIPVDITDALEAAAWVANMPVEMYAQITKRT